ncbi:MAG: SurA N-terminal domain-containing protein [Caldiserica bacterium]|nr:SurA N-terminal domain-containing protein [Caldisericota bacterium]
MGKESKIRQERKAGLLEKPGTHHKDRFPIVMRVVAIILIVTIATWGLFFAIKSTTGMIAYQVGTEKILQSDITAGVQNYIDMYKQYGMDLTTAENAGTLKSVRQNVIDTSIEEELFIQYAKSKNMKIDDAKLKTALDTEVGTVPAAVWNGHSGIH